MRAASLGGAAVPQPVAGRNPAIAMAAIRMDFTHALPVWRTLAGFRSTAGRGYGRVFDAGAGQG